jgi:hypothetical protein
MTSGFQGHLLYSGNGQELISQKQKLPAGFRVTWEGAQRSELLT